MPEQPESQGNFLELRQGARQWVTFYFCGMKYQQQSTDGFSFCRNNGEEMARSATVAASRWRVWVHPGRSRGNLCSTRHATGPDDCLAQRSPMNWNQNSDIAVLEKHHVIYVTGFIHLQQFIWSSAAKSRGVSVVWFSKSLPRIQRAFVIVHHRQEDFAFLPVEVPPLPSTAFDPLALTDETADAVEGNLSALNGQASWHSSDGLEFFFPIFWDQWTSFVSYGFMLFFTFESVESTLHGGHREFRQQRSWRVHDRQAGTRRVQGFGKTQRIPKEIQSVLQMLAWKGAWILDLDGPSDHQVAFAMAYFWVQPIFSIL